jgi:MFS family permease
VATRKSDIAPGTPRSPHALIALRYRDFRLFWFGQAVSVAGTQMRQAAVAWQIYVLSHSAVALGVLGLVRVVPIVLLSLFGGVIADAIDRRRLLLVTQAVLLCVSVALTVVSAAGHTSLWSIYVLVALGTAAVAFDNPARQALVPSLVPRDDLTNALSLSTTTFQVAMVVGPSLAGFVIAAWSVSAVYAIDAVSYLAVIVALVLIHPPPIAGVAQTVSVRAAVEGLQFVWREPILLSTMALDFVATFFGSASALLPIFAHDVLHAGSEGYGVLYAAPAIGAIGAGVVMSFVAMRIRHQGRVILLSVAAYSAFTILFGLSHVFLLSVLFLAGTGIADTVSMILRQTVRQIVTPDELRGRMTSVSMVFFMGGPQLGEFEAGVVARGYGAPFSVVAGGVAALVATTLIAWRFAGLRDYRLSQRA